MPTIRQRFEPWEPIQENLQGLMPLQRGVYDNPQEFYPGSSVGSRSAQTLAAEQSGLGLIRGATNPAMENYFGRLMGGQFLDQSTNPALRGLADRGAADISRQFKQIAFPGASMMGQGRVGSGAELRQQGMAYRGLGEALQRNYSDIYGQNYARERGFMQQGPQMMAQYGANRRGDIGLGSQLGFGADAYAQRLVDDQRARWDFRQQEPTNRLNQYQQGLFQLGQMGGTQQTRTPGQGFGGAQIAGTVLGIGGMLMGGPLGGAIGGGLGGMIGGGGGDQYGSFSGGQWRR